VQLFALPTNPAAHLCENFFYTSGKTFLWVSAICAQLLRFSTVRIRVRLRSSVSCYFM